MGLLNSKEYLTSPKYSQSSILWRSRRPPKSIAINLVVTVSNFFFVAINFGDNCDFNSLSGLICIPQILKNRRMVLAVVEWPSSDLQAFFKSQIREFISIGSVSTIQLDDSPTTIDDCETCDLLASYLTRMVKIAFRRFARDVHVDKDVPSETLYFNMSELTVLQIDYDGSPSPECWDTKLNDRTISRMLIEMFDLKSPEVLLTFSDRCTIDPVMATVMTKFDVREDLKSSNSPSLAQSSSS